MHISPPFQSIIYFTFYKILSDVTDVTLKWLKNGKSITGSYNVL